MTAHTHPLPPRRVLIVEHDRSLADSLVTLFRSAGYDGWAFYSAETALAATSWAPHLAVIAISLPGINGLDLALHLRHICPECELLLLSDRPSEIAPLTRLTHEGETFDLLRKPIPHRLLLALAADRLSAA